MSPENYSPKISPQEYCPRKIAPPENFTPCSRVSIVNFEQVITGWDIMDYRSDSRL